MKKIIDIVFNENIDKKTSHTPKSYSYGPHGTWWSNNTPSFNMDEFVLAKCDDGIHRSGIIVGICRFGNKVEYHVRLNVAYKEKFIYTEHVTNANYC